MFRSFSQENTSRDGVTEKKRLANHPFQQTKVKRVASKQSTINFFLTKSNSSLGLGTEELKKKPLTEVPTSELNKSESTSSYFSSQGSKTSSIRELTKADSFENSGIEHDINVNSRETKVTNLKNIKPFSQSIIPKPSRITKSLYEIPSVAAPVILTEQTKTASEVQERVIKPVGLRKAFKPVVKLGHANSLGQTTLDFGAKNPAPKKRVNPWDSAPLLTSKKIKNPRIKDETPKASSTGPQSLNSFGLSDEQKVVLDLALKRQNIFYTGSAGTGKSVLLREIVHRLRLLHGASAVAVTASTGLAAVNIGGVTINRFSGLGIASQGKTELAARVKKNADVREKWKRTKVLIIDEISMLDGKFLDKLEYVAKTVRSDSRPFGGIQLILTGDFYQLPPVDTKKGSERPIFCFESYCWKSCIQKTILLKKVFRQADPEFIGLLNAVRTAEIDHEAEQKFIGLSREVRYDDGIQPTELFATRYEVESSNSRRLNSLSGSIKTYEANDNNTPEKLRYLLDATMAAKSLTLKVDAQVMMIKNIDETLVNGSVGIVLTFLSKAAFDKYKIFSQNSINDDQSIRELKMLNKCYGQSNVPDEVLSFANRFVSNKSEYLQVATSILNDTTEVLPIVKFSVKNQPARIECIERQEFLGETSSTNASENIMRLQIPLLLSWALSIHKSQGQTLDRVKVDLTRVFEAGQVYVALSRAVSKESLQVINFNKSKIRTNSKVKAFYDGLESFII